MKVPPISTNALRVFEVPAKACSPVLVEEHAWPDDESDEYLQAMLGRLLSQGKKGTLVLFCPCGEPLRIRPPRNQSDRKEIAIVEKSVHQNANCPRSTARKWSNSGAPSGQEIKRRIALRLNIRYDEVKKGFGVGTGSPSVLDPSPVSDRTLRGFLGELSDRSGLTEWRPGRIYGTSPAELAAHIRRKAWDDHDFEKRFRWKVVFPQIELTTARQAVAEACNFGGAVPRNLRGRALVVNIQKSLDLDGLLLFESPWAPELHLAMPVDQEPGERFKKQVRANKGKAQVAAMLRQPKLRPDEAFLHIIALVHQDPTGPAGQFRVIEFSWQLMNRRGMLLESTYEFETAERLYSLGIPHQKLASTFLRETKRARKPDYIVTDKSGRIFVLEVDVGDKEKPSKQQRNTDFAAAGIPVISWDPRKSIDLLDALKRNGFQW